MASRKSGRTPWYIWTLVALGGIATLLFAGIVSLAQGQVPARTMGTVPVLMEWRPLGEWRGNGMSETQAFGVTEDEWRIHWSYEGPPTGYSHFSVYVYCDGRLETMITTKLRRGSGVSYVHETGACYLSTNVVGDWTLRAEERHERPAE